MADLQGLCQKLRICVIGETILDEFWKTTALSMPPASPFLAVECSDSERYLGGAYPVARDLSLFCDDVRLLTNSVPAENRTDRPTLQICELGRGNLPIRITRYSAAGTDDPIFIACHFPGEPLWASARSPFFAAHAAQIAAADLVIVLDFGHGLIDEDVASIIAHHSSFLAVNCQANGGRLPFNTIWKYPRMDLVSLNCYEAKLNLNSAFSSSSALLARAIAQRSRATFSIVTDGPLGAWLCSGLSVTYQRSLVTHVADTIGCGDAFLGFSAVAARLGFDTKGILEIGSAAAAAKARMRAHREPITPASLH